MKGKNEEITGIKKINNAKRIIRTELLRLLSFRFLIQSLIILKIIIIKLHIVNYLGVRI